MFYEKLGSFQKRSTVLAKEFLKSYICLNQVKFYLKTRYNLHQSRWFFK